MSAEIENVAPEVQKVEEKDESKEKQMSSLLAEGKRLLIAGNADLAIDKLSDAALVGSTLYGELGAEMFEVYLFYAKAQLQSANDIAMVVNTKVDDEADSTDDDEAESADEKKEDENGKEVEENGTSAEETDVKNAEENEKGEDVEEDTTSVKNEGEEAPADDALTDMIRSAWDLFCLARKIAVRELEKAVDKKEWTRRQADTDFGLGQLMIVDEQFELALEELEKSLATKKEVLDEFDRELAEIHVEIARVQALREEYPLAAQYYQNAIDVIQKKIEHLESTKTEETAKEIEKEINDLEEISRDIQAHIKEASEQVKLDQKLKDELKLRIFGSEPFQPVEPKDDEEVNDISELVRKRRKPMEVTETEEKRVKTTE